MKDTRWILAAAGSLGIAAWVFDAVVDAAIFYDDRSFVSVLVTDVPAHELYVRALLVALFVGFGIVVAYGTREVRERERDVRLFRRLVDAASDSVFVIDPETGNITDVNETACDVLGYDRSALVGMSVADINPDFEDSNAFREFLDSPEGETLEYCETRHVRADETTFPVEISASDVTIDDREYRIAIVRDVTERKRRERRITHYKQAVESSRDQLAAIDTELEFLFANQAYRSFHGIGTETVHGQSLDQFLADEEFDRIESHVRDALAGERISFETTRADDSKDDRTLDVRYWPLRDADGAIQGVGASLRNVTDHKEMVEDLRQARERYESLFDSIRDAILVADTDRRIIDCNPAFSELFGYALEEIEGKPTSFVDASDEEFAAMGQSLGEHMHDPTVVQTVRYEKQSGQVFPGETNVFYLRNRDGEITGFIGLIRDVSDRQARVTQIRTIDRVLRHNLSNALTVILGNAETIAEGETDDARWSAKRIIKTGEKLQATAAKEREITSFLAESRPAVERDAVAVVENAIADVRERYPDADLKLDLPATQPVLAVDHFDRAIEELLENALTHSDRAEPSVTVTLEQIGDSATIEIADDGPGIPEMERAVLTGDHEIEPLFHGRGIGLWLVHLIVQYSDGQLSVAENDPRGSVVTVRLRTP